MVSVCLPSDALLQHLPSYLDFSYLGREGISSWLLQQSTAAPPYLDEGYLLTATIPDLQHGIAPLGPPAPVQPLLLWMLLPATGSGLRRGCLLPAAAPGLWLGVAPQGHRPWPRVRDGFSQPPLTSDVGCLVPANTDLGHRIAPPGRRP